MESFNEDNCEKLCKGGCKLSKPINEFGKKSNGEVYKICVSCRDKKTVSKREILEPISLDNDNKNDERKKKEKRENRPTISNQKQQLILKEQDYMCRGPSVNDNREYECDMNVNNKRFSDKKSSEPQFDHIIRWKEGGNGIGNLQALCASCHLMKTSMENMINEDEKALQCPRIKTIYECLTKPKYEEIESSSSEEEDFFRWNRPIRKR